MKEEKKIYKSIPASETGSTVTNTTSSGRVFLITNCPEKERFTLWEVRKDGYEKVGTSSNPLKFEIPW